MKRITYVMLAVFISVFLVARACEAISVAPALSGPTYVGQTATFVIIANFASLLPTCTLQINFGDGPLYSTAGVCPNAGTSCYLSATHIYTAPGTFTVTVRSSACTLTNPAPAPDPATTTISVICTPLITPSQPAPPSGTVGQPYSWHATTVNGGQTPYSYALVGGSLPPGLSMNPSTGQITGTPITAGSYSATIRVTDSCTIGAQSLNTSFAVTIIAAPVSPVVVSAAPSVFNAPRGQSSTRSAAYQFTGSPSLNTSLASSSGSFLVEGEIIETNPVPITVAIQGGRGQIVETMFIPVRVIERALQRGVARFTYVRAFSDGSLTTTVTLNFSITTEAGADFEIQRIELYFDNRKIETTVERHYPHLKAYADIRFVGTGLLQGYWEVDGRLLSRVDEHLTFGRSVTLQTPEIPSLPTFDAGTHTVRFVITNPAMSITLPSIIYFVTPEEFKEEARPIKLISPADDSHLEYTSLHFRWEVSGKADVYFIEFLGASESDPIFSAYTREGSYTLPPSVLNTIFYSGKKYYWKVTAFDAEHMMNGESPLWAFTLAEGSRAK